MKPLNQLIDKIETASTLCFFTVAVKKSKTAPTDNTTNQETPKTPKMGAQPDSAVSI